MFYNQPPLVQRLPVLALLSAAIALATAAATVRAQAPQSAPFRIERLHPALDAVIAPDANLELLGDRFALTEGPVWVADGPEGYLLFSDNAANVIYKWERNRSLSV